MNKPISLEKKGSARNQSTLAAEQRNSYDNLILQCPNHNAEVNNNEDDWPVEKLFQIKLKHELTVHETVDQFKISKQAMRRFAYKDLDAHFW